MRINSMGLECTLPRLSKLIMHDAVELVDSCMTLLSPVPCCNWSSNSWFSKEWACDIQAHKVVHTQNMGETVPPSIYQALVYLYGTFVEFTR